MTTQDLTAYQGVALSYNPDDLRFGYTDSTQYFMERQRNRVLLQGKTRLLQLQGQYAQSYLKATDLSVLGYRDMLLSLALAMSVRCVQCTDTGYTTLTTQAKRYWSLYGNRFWSSLPSYHSNPDFQAQPGFYGLAGSLAFWLYKHEDSGQGLYPVQLLQRMLSYFWSDLSLSADQSPQQRQAQCWQNLNFTNAPFAAYTSVLQALADATDPSLPLHLVQQLKQSLLHAPDWSLLRQRLLLGEYADSLRTLLLAIQTEATTNEPFRLRYKLPVGFDLSTLLQTLDQIAAPAGMPLVYQAFALQGLVAACTYLTETLTATEQALSLTTFMQQHTYDQHRLTLARHLATTYDAMGALAYFETQLEAKGLAYRFYLSALQLLQNNDTAVLLATDSSRLTAFLDAA